MIDYENLLKSNQEFFPELEEAFREVLHSGWYVLGGHVADFEKSFAAYTGAEYCVGVANGMEALEIALLALNLKKGGEVIVPANTYIATILAIVNVGLKPVLVEPDITSYNLDPKKIEEKINPQTVAIMVVHLYGKCADMGGIMEIAEKHNLRVVEDCAQAHGAKYRGKMTGTFGDVGAFSFYPTKNLGALGDAGCVISSVPALEQTFRRLRNYGSDVKYHNEIIGKNSRLDELQAAFLLVKLKKIQTIIEHKRKLADIYSKNLKKDYILPQLSDDYYDTYHIYNVRHPRRDELKEYLFDNGVKTEVHYPIPPHQQKAMKGFFDGESYPISEEIHKTTLSLPISFFHTEEDVRQVVEIMNKF